MTTSNFGPHDFKRAQKTERLMECGISLKDIKGHCKHGLYARTQVLRNLMANPKLEVTLYFFPSKSTELVIRKDMQIWMFL